jgi:RNA recognition motif-containing protein
MRGPRVTVRRPARRAAGNAGRTGGELDMKLWVGNLSKVVTEAQLNDLGLEYGSLVASNLATEKSTGQSKGFGFLEFSTDDAGNAAIAGLDGREVSGQAIKVNEARPRKDAVNRP